MRRTLAYFCYKVAWYVTYLLAMGVGAWWKSSQFNCLIVQFLCWTYAEQKLKNAQLENTDLILYRYSFKTVNCNSVPMQNVTVNNLSNKYRFNSVQVQKVFCEYSFKTGLIPFTFCSFQSGSIQKVTCNLYRSSIESVKFLTVQEVTKSSIY